MARRWRQETAGRRLTRRVVTATIRVSVALARGCRQPGQACPIELTYRSQSASEIVGFAPGIGITSYDYARASDRSYVQLKLSALGRR